MELLARFELATRSKEAKASLEPYDLIIESALRAWDAVASSTDPLRKTKSPSNWMGFCFGAASQI